MYINDSWEFPATLLSTLHLDPEFGALTSIAHGETSVHVLLDDRLRHVEPDPCSLVRPLGGKVWFEYPFDEMLGNTAGVVAYRHDRFAVFHTCGYDDPGVAGIFLRERIPRIDKDVEEYLGVFVRVAVDRREIALVDFDGDSLIPETFLYQGEGLRDRLTDAEIRHHLVRLEIVPEVIDGLGHVGNQIHRLVDEVV